MSYLARLLGKPVVWSLALLVALPITPIIACLLYGWSY